MFHMRVALVWALLQAPVLLSAKPLVRREAFTGDVDSQALQPDDAETSNEEDADHGLDGESLEDSELEEGELSEGEPKQSAQKWNDGLDDDIEKDTSGDKDVEKPTSNDYSASNNTDNSSSFLQGELQGRRRAVLSGQDQSHCVGVAHGPYYLSIGRFRFGQVDDNHFSASGQARRRRYQSAKTMQIYRNDGTLHPGPRTDWHSFGRRRAPSGTSDGRVLWGPEFFQVGKWRMGAIDENNFAVAHKDGKTVQTYKNDGCRDAPKSDGRLWAKPVSPLNTTFAENKIKFGKNFVQFGETWRLGQVDSNHASISWRLKDDGKGGPRRRVTTPTVFRMDGTLHENTNCQSPRTSWNTWGGAITECAFGIGYDR